jgi:transmembrane sensor
MDSKAKERITSLLRNHIENSITEKERNELDQLVQQYPNVKLLMNKLSTEEGVEQYLKDQRESSKKLWAKILQKTSEVSGKENPEKGKVISFRIIPWIRYVAASLVFFLVAGGLYWYFDQTDKKNQLPTAATNTSPDIRPGGRKATLQLADGSVIELNQAARGLLAEQGSAKVFKSDSNGIVYDAGSLTASSKNGTVAYNTITTPVGGEYIVVLPDKSKIYLNAASSLRYPTTFTGDDRVVELTGEGFFEVAKMKQHGRHIPFKVKVNNTEIEVLGTAFNVNAYRDEPAIKTTLIEGSVLWSLQHEKRILKPGQQAQITENGQIKLNASVDVEQVIAWKNGTFHFNNENLEDIMKQLIRWYDVEVEYETKVSGVRIGGMISRNKNLSEVLKALELSGIHFRIDGRKIVVIK